MLFRRGKFTGLLAALVALAIAHPMVREGAAANLTYDLLATTVSVAAIVLVFPTKGSRIIATLLALPFLAGVFVSERLAGLDPRMAGVFLHLLPAIFLAYTVLTILRTIFGMQEVLADSINGALCGYLLIGLAFGHLYCLTEELSPGAFANMTPPRDVPHLRATLTYFSFVTLTTLGYGDITPHVPTARTLAWVEAVTGQFYVAVVVAELVALKVSASSQLPRGGGNGPGNPRP